jgi:nucleoside-diphosphate-sugar epimerase
MKVLITGATGFIGSYVLRRFMQDQRAEVAILLRDHSDTWRIDDVLEKAVCVRVNLDDRQAVRTALRRFGPDMLIHLAWQGVPGVFRNDKEQIRNIGRTLDLLEQSCDVGAKSFIGLGSQAEYGPRQGPIGEDAPLRPTTVYGAAKVSTCLLARQFCERNMMRFVWLRLFSSYGPKDSPSWMIPSVILDLIQNRRPLLTEGRQLWDYLYVTDAAEAVYLAGQTPGATGIFNLGSGRVEMICKIVEHIRNVIDPALPLGFGEVPYRDNQVMHLQAKIDRLQASVGWRPNVMLDEGLKQTVNWYRKHAQRYTI